jgi:NitT/TauT family transport system substrate-binding protein
MLAGEVDLSTAADMPIMANTFKRDDFRVLCSIGHTDNGAWILARRDRGIAQPADLRGKRVATQEGSAVHYFLSSFLVYHKIPEEEVKIVFLPAVELPGALVRGEIDAFSMRNPFVAEAKAQLGDNAVELFEPHAYRQFFNLAMRVDALQSDPPVADAVVAALVRAARFIEADREDAIAVVAGELGPGRTDEVRGDWDRFVFDVTLGQSLIRCLENQARWAVRHGRTDAQAAPRFLRMLYPQALKRAAPGAFSVIE